jgi:hypothetical protein
MRPRLDLLSGNDASEVFMNRDPPKSQPLPDMLGMSDA